MKGQLASNPGGRADGSRKQRGSRTLTAINVSRPWERPGMGNRKARDYVKAQARASAWEALQSSPRGFAEDVCFPSIGLRRLQLAIVPSFEPGYSWDVRELDGTFRLFRSNVVAEPIDELLRLRGYTQLQAESDELLRFLGRIDSISLRIAPSSDDTAGLDGTTFHLALCGEEAESRFRWWEEPPAGWEQLGLIAHEMIKRFMSLKAAAD